MAAVRVGPERNKDNLENTTIPFAPLKPLRALIQPYAFVGLLPFRLSSDGTHVVRPPLQAIGHLAVTLSPLAALISGAAGTKTEWSINT